MKKLICLLALLAMFAVEAQADIVFIADSRGNVAKWNTDTNSGAYLGTVPGSVSQVLGLAYDASANRVLVLDRLNQNVFEMNENTGASSLLFSTPGVTFQGGAVSGGLLYGIDENTQKVVAYSFAGVNQGLTGPARGHRHALGVDPATGQLYDWSNADSTIREINADGTTGSAVVTSAGPLFDDIDPFGGNFLGTDFSNTLFLIDGVTGNRSTFLSGAQTSAIGLGGNLAGVVLQAPEPGSLALLASGIVLVFRRRRRKA